MKASGIQGTEWVDYIRGGAYEKWVTKIDAGSTLASLAPPPHPKTSLAATEYHTNSLGKWGLSYPKESGNGLGGSGACLEMFSSFSGNEESPELLPLALLSVWK